MRISALSSVEWASEHLNRKCPLRRLTVGFSERLIVTGDTYSVLMDLGTRYGKASPTLRTNEGGTTGFPVLELKDRAPFLYSNIAFTLILKECGCIMKDGWRWLPCTQFEVIKQIYFWRDFDG